MYTPVDSRIWSDEKFIRFSPTAKLLFMYLLTNPHRNILGLYYLPRGYVVEDLKLSDEQLTSAWRELIESNRITYDEQAQMILVNNFLRYNPVRGEKSIKGAINKLEEIPKTALTVNLMTFLTEKGDSPESALISAIQQKNENNNTPLMPHDKPLGSTVKETVKVRSNRNQKSPLIPASGEVAPKAREETAIERRFNEFWEAYPKKAAKKIAFNAWKKLKPSEELHKAILKAIEAAKQSDQWQRDNGQYIPNPATWINGGRWEDEVRIGENYENNQAEFNHAEMCGFKNALDRAPVADE